VKVAPTERDSPHFARKGWFSAGLST
jgi:hypothetical protein